MGCRIWHLIALSSSIECQSQAQRQPLLLRVEHTTLPWSGARALLAPPPAPHPRRRRPVLPAAVILSAPPNTRKRAAEGIGCRCGQREVGSALPVQVGGVGVRGLAAAGDADECMYVTLLVYM